MNARSVLKGVAAGIFAVAGASAVCAGTKYYWTGDGDDDHWTTVANWTVEGLPAESYPGADGTAFFTNAMNVVRLDSNLTVEDEATQYGGYTKIYNDDPSTTNTLKFTGLWMLQASSNCTFEANGSVVIETVGSPGYVKGKTLASGGARITMDVAAFDDNPNQSFVATGAGSKLTVNGAWFKEVAGKNTGVSFESYDGAEVVFKPYKDGSNYRNPLDLITLKAVNANLYANDGNTKFTAAVDVTCDHGYMDLVCLQPAKPGSNIALSNGCWLRLRGATKLPAAESATTTLTLGDNGVLEEYDSSITLGKGLTVKLAPTVASSETDGRIVTRADRGGAITLNSGVKFEIDCSAFKDFTGSKTIAVIEQKRSASAATYSLPAAEDVTLTGEGVERCTYAFTTADKKLLLTITAGDPVAEIEGKCTFQSLQAAIDAAAAGDTIELLRNVSYFNETVNATNKNATLDGNGYTLTWNMPNNGAGLYVGQNSEFNIRNVKIETTKTSRAVKYEDEAGTGSKGTLDNVMITTDGVALTVAGTESVVTVTNCTFVHEGQYKDGNLPDFEHNLSVVSTWGNGNIVIRGGTFTSDRHCVYIFSTGGTIDVFNGVFESGATTGDVVHVTGGDSLSSYHSKFIVEPDAIASFKGSMQRQNNKYVEVSIAGGTYDRDPTYISGKPSVADGYMAEQIDGGLWQVRAIIPVTKVEIGGAPEAALSVGGSVTLTVTVGPDNADIKTVKWTSSDEEVATVDADGVVTALAEGEVEITATADYGEAFDTVKITVGAGSAYPSYIGDDAWKQARYAEWAKVYGDDKDSANEKAFLLNVAPADAEDAEKEFKITSVAVDGDTVTVEWTKGPGDGYNGKVEIQGSETPNGPWAPKADDQGQRFFKAILK